MLDSTRSLAVCPPPDKLLRGGAEGNAVNGTEGLPDGELICHHPGSGFEPLPGVCSRKRHVANKNTPQLERKIKLRSSV